MNARRLGKTDVEVSEIGFGAWAIGGSWGETDDDESLAAMHAAVDAGVTFFDTADVYGDGRSERLIAQAPARAAASRSSSRRSSAGARRSRSRSTRTRTSARWLERSRENLGVDASTSSSCTARRGTPYYTPSVFEACDRLVDEGLVRAYGVSVEKVEEALKAIEYPGVATVQIIFNIFRQRPAELFFEQARRRDVGVIVRVPLASGLLTGKFDARHAASPRTTTGRSTATARSSTSARRSPGVDFERGLEAVEELRPLVPGGATLAQLALRWILGFDAVSTVIPGAKTPDQARANAAAADLRRCRPRCSSRSPQLYRERIGPHVHQRW